MPEAWKASKGQCSSLDTSRQKKHVWKDVVGTWEELPIMSDTERLKGKRSVQVAGAEGA